MGEVIHIDAWMLGAGASIITMLLVVIAKFLWRMLEQFDHLTQSVGLLNETMLKIHADLKIDITRLEERNNSNEQELHKFHQLWDRVRKSESDIIEIRSGGCGCRQAVGGH